MTSDVRMLVGSDFFSGVKERPPTLPPSCVVHFRAVPMPKVAEPRQHFQLKFSIETPLFDFGSDDGAHFVSVQRKFMPNLKSIRHVAVKRGHL